MFPRIIKSKGKRYLVLVESYSESGKKKHNVVTSFGNIETLGGEEWIERFAMSLLKYCCKEKRKIFDITKVKEEDRKKWGIIKVVKKLWEDFEMEEILMRVVRDKRIEFDYLSAINLMVMDRLRDPKSKLRSYEEQERYWGIKRNELHHLYRALDILSETKEEIEKELFYKNRTLFNMKVDVVLYEVTTFYFESVKRDGLKEFGYSKDSKVNEVQVLLGLMIDMEGRPVGYEIFPGDKFEGHTLVSQIEKIKKRFEIQKIIIVGDQAMLSEGNLKIIRDAKYEYVVGSRIKNKSEKLKKKILDLEGYKNFQLNGEDEDCFKYKEIETDDGKMILTYSKKEQKRIKKKDKG